MHTQRKISGNPEAAGFEIREVRENAAYRFLSDSAQGASRKFGVKSVSLVAVKPA